MKKEKERQKGVLVVNRKARRNYAIADEIEAGVMLTGAEVKSLRAGRGKLEEAFVRVSGGEVWMVNFQIPAFQANLENYDPARQRKLLLHAREIESLARKTEQKGMALVPLKVYVKNRHVKLLVGVGKGKREFEKREDIKKRELKRELRREFKERQIR
ncbi:MAG: SsrA-binding protein SmpB [Candidatus Chisholmbacteria bacterium]|nr:SsrA-binding protein SmpB [Candidatus Chisholmbacteria bacterium]